jgi:hypothetical protein
MMEGDQGGEGDNDLAEQLLHWKTQARKSEQRAKANADAAKRLQDIENANKTELQKALDAQVAAERERDEAMANHTRMMAAAANNLPVELIEHLGTGTEDEINERAELFASVIEGTAQAIAEQMLKDAGIDIAALQQGANGGTPQLQPQQQGGSRPVESLRAGSAPSGTMPNTQEQWFRQLLGNM